MERGMTKQAEAHTPSLPSPPLRSPPLRSAPLVRSCKTRVVGGCRRHASLARSTAHPSSRRTIVEDEPKQQQQQQH
eukprot:2907105-Rhodomonas_salina.1